MAAAAGQIMHIDHWFFGLKGNIGQLAAIGRPDRRDDGLARGQRGLRIGAIGIGDLQFVAPGAFHDIGDARGKHTRLASELFVDEIGDAVRGGAQLRAGMRVGLRAEGALLEHVGETDARRITPFAGCCDGASDHGVRAALLQLGEGWCGFFSQHTTIDHTEHATAFKVGADD